MLSLMSEQITVHVYDIQCYCEVARNVFQVLSLMSEPITVHVSMVT